MNKKNLRKCAICNKDINILHDDYIKDTRFKHTECFREKELTKQKNRLSIEATEEKIKIIKDKMKIEQEEIDRKELEIVNKKKQNIKNNINYKQSLSSLIDYFQKEYDICLTGNEKNDFFYIRLSSISNGNYKGLKEGISFEDLLYMFKQKRDYLNKIADKKQRQGTGFKDNKARLLYDLSVIISKYDSYKEWKEKQKLLQSEIQLKIKNENENHINYSYINQQIINEKNNKNNKDIDINDLLDEI